MIEEEYKRLLKMLDEGMDPKGPSLEDILRETVIFFEALRKEFPSASLEEREKMVYMMTNLHMKLKEISKKAAEEAGMSEEELASFGEDPSNFTPEQWQEIQATRRKLYDSARRFSSSMSKGSEEEKPQKAPKSPFKGTARRPKRKEWKKT
jgi:hypothetical protein